MFLIKVKTWCCINLIRLSTTTISPIIDSLLVFTLAYMHPMPYNRFAWPNFPSTQFRSLTACRNSFILSLVYSVGRPKCFPFNNANEDWINDHFKGDGIGINEFKMLVFDRWAIWFFILKSSTMHGMVPFKVKAVIL